MAETSVRDGAVGFSENAIGSATAEWSRESEETPVFAVVSAVADAADEDPLALPPLTDVIDPDALNGLFLSRPAVGVEAVEFRYAGYDVVVRGDGEVAVHGSDAV